MKFKYLYTCIFFFTYAIAFAQNNQLYELTGTITDTNNEALPFVTVTIFTANDSTLVNGAITDINGTFTLKAAAGEYSMAVRSIGFLQKDIPLIELSGNKNIGPISLEEDVKTLDEVVVQADKSQMELSLDKRTFNVGKDMSNMGGTAADILDNIPAVSVDIEGNVSLRGSNNVQILIDGKPSGLLGIDGSSGLRQLQGNIIEKVEVITNPSARYDAEGSGGILNIVLKKDKEKGINGSFDVTTGYPDNHAVSANINLRRKWINFFVNYAVNYRKTPGGGISEQQFFLEDSTFYTNRDRTRERGGISNTIRTGMDIYINPKNSFTASLIYRKSDQDNNGRIIYQDLSETLEEINRTVRNDNENELEDNFEFDLSYKKTFSNKGHILTADIQFRESDEIESSDFEETYSNSEQMLIQRSSNNEGNRNILTQADYVYPFSQKGKLEAGYRGTLRTITNNFIVEEQNDMGDFETIESLTNNFVYDENIYAFYFIVGNKIKKYSYQVGLRSETTDIRTDLKETNEVNEKNYTDFFPSAFFTYDLTESGSIQASYSRRLRRPRFWDLNPFFTFSDARNIRTGNPDLDPEYTNSFELGYLKNFKASNFYVGTYYRRSTGEIERVSYVEDDGITYTLPVNLSVENSYGMEINGSIEFNGWWKANANINIFGSQTNGTFQDQVFDFQAFTWRSRIVNQIKIKEVWNTQLSLDYRAPQNIAQGKRLSITSIDLGVNRDILSDKATIGFSVRDLLNKRIRRSETRGENFYNYDEFQWRARQFLVNFTYRLNQKKQRKGGRGRNDYDDDEF